MNHKLRFIFIFLLVFASTAQAEASCSDNDVQLQVLGSGGPELDDQRVSSGYLIWIKGQARVLVDTGAGTSVNFGQTGAKFEDLQAILFTHLHVDHSADLPAFIKGSFFTARDNDLVIYGPAGNSLMPSTSEFVQNLLGNQGAFRYLSDYVNTAEENDYHLQTVDVPLEPRKIVTYQINDGLSLGAIPVHHGPISAVAWRVNAAGCSVTFSGDMNNNYQTLPILAEDSDMLVVSNAVPESAEGVAAQLHMRPSQIGKIAQQSQVKQLILSHRMKRTLGKERQTKKIIEQYYSGPIFFANDLESFPLQR